MLIYLLICFCYLFIYLLFISLDNLSQQEYAVIKLRQRDTPTNFIDGNAIAAWEIQTNEESPQKCEHNAQHIDIIKHAKKSRTEEEKSCDEINEENIFENCSDISQVIENNQELPSASKTELEGDQLYTCICNIVSVIYKITFAKN